MQRFETIAIALVGLAAMAGCQQIGQALKKNEAPPPGAPSRVYDAPVNRVVDAAFDASQPDLFFNKDVVLDFPGLVISPRGTKAIDDAAASGKPTLEADIQIDDLTFGSGRIMGQMKDGREVTVWFVDLDPGQKTEVKVHIGKTHDAPRDGDLDRITAYFDRISDKLAHPTTKADREPVKVDFDFNIKSGPAQPAATPEKRGPDR